MDPGPTRSTSRFSNIRGLHEPGEPRGGSGPCTHLMSQNQERDALSTNIAETTSSSSRSWTSPDLPPY
jgi:hypothetical protein